MFADVLFILLRVSSFEFMLLGDWFVVMGMFWPVFGGNDGERLFRDVGITHNLTINGTGTVSGSQISSDIRLKKNITATPSKWDFVKGLQIKDYTRIASESEETGIIAQDLELLEPIMVVEYETGDEKTTETYKAIKINSIVFSLAKALQEAQTRIEDSQARIEALEAKMLI